jgi:RNA recognition motif-containing protein
MMLSGDAEQQQLQQQQGMYNNVMMNGNQSAMPGGVGGVMLQQPTTMTLPPLSMMQPQQPMMMSSQQQDKINRELFVGNTPPGTSELLVLHFVNAAMRRVGLCLPYETPVLNSRVNNKFAFIELSSAEMATRALNLNGIPFLNTYLKISRPSKYTGMNVSAQTWQQLTGQATTLMSSTGDVTNVMSLIDPEQEKIKRELFIGNTTPEMTESMLKEFLGNAIQQVGLASMPGNPITACRVSGKFAFIELRTPEEAANALNLNNIPYLGTALRVGRPSKYTGPPDHHGNWEDILAKYMSGELQLPSPNQPQQQQPYEASLSQQQNNIVDPGIPTRVVEIQHMLTMNDLSNEEEYSDILEDTKEECSQFGTLINVVIPKGHEIGATKVFLEYASIQDASNAITKLQGRTFDGRLVQATYYDETKFANREYS